MIVTGASSGIGRALAELAVRAGWRVFAVGRRAERLEGLRRSVGDATDSLATLSLDIRERGAPERIVREALERFGRIDALVNIAGTVAAGPISLQSDEALREQLEVHVIVPLALLREALGELRERRGQVVFVGSGVARIPVGGLGAYPPAKAAVRNMTRVARNELRAFGIAVTYVDPGAVATEFMTRAGFSGPPPWIGASPIDVARRILDAIERRKPFVNAVPWQAAFVALGELFPILTDLVLSRAPEIVGTQATGLQEGVTPLPAAASADGQPPSEQVSSSQTREIPEYARNLSPPQSMPPKLEPPKPEPAKPEPPKPEPIKPEPPKPEPPKPSASSPKLEAALEPLAQRMQRSSLSVTFLDSLLVPGAELETGDVALRWAGMPNKHERVLTHQVLEALADANFLTRTRADHYRVQRAAN